ncbi:hypothetical protein [Actinoplanes sp. GCM10030250]|uniref:hypothetical protein n=1 Tax=Actinoplanes sp. GCM10030250 TaxID=3273376 RepID=UPI003615DBF7
MVVLMRAPFLDPGFDVVGTPDLAGLQVRGRLREVVALGNLIDTLPTDPAEPHPDFMRAHQAQLLGHAKARDINIAGAAERPRDGVHPVPMPAGLDSLREQRRAQRDRPEFGALAGREAVFLRRPWDEPDETEPQIYYEHLGPDNRRLRQVEVYADETAIRTGPEDWPLNPPNDLYDPDLVQWATSAEDFEQLWRQAPGEGEQQ